MSRARQAPPRTMTPRRQRSGWVAASAWWPGPCCSNGYAAPSHRTRNHETTRLRRVSEQRPGVEELDRLSTEELRQRAFERAEHHRDVGFFWDLIKHLPPAEDIASEDASAGHITGGLADVVEIVRELMGR